MAVAAADCPVVAVLLAVADHLRPVQAVMGPLCGLERCRMLASLVLALLHCPAWVVVERQLSQAVVWARFLAAALRLQSAGDSGLLRLERLVCRLQRERLPSLLPRAAMTHRARLQASAAPKA